MIPWIEAHGRLIESLGVIEVAVAAKQMQVTLGLVAPIQLQIARAVSEAAAAVEHDVVAVGGRDAHAGRPAAVDPWLETSKRSAYAQCLRPIGPQGCLRRCPRCGPGVDAPCEVLEHLQQKVLFGLLPKRQALFA